MEFGVVLQPNPPASGLIANAGAYGRTMSSEYNLRPPAEELFI